jgi:hypothetical protein
MPNVSIDTPKKPEQVSAFETYVLRFVATFLCALFGFVLVILGYGFVSFFEFDSEEFSKYTFVYFSISLAIWIVIGLVTPYVYFRGFFEELRGSTFERTAAFIAAFGIFVILYWYVLTFLAGVIVSVFGIE